MPKTLGWANTYCLHTWPTDDLIAHELSPACVCSPTQEETLNNGERWFLFIHDSLDRRETHE